MTKVVLCLLVAVLAQTKAHPTGIPSFDDYDDVLNMDMTATDTDTDTDTDADVCHVKLSRHAIHTGTCGRTLRSGHVCSETPDDGFACAESKCDGDIFHAGVCSANGKCHWGECTYAVTVRFSFDTKTLLTQKQLTAVQAVLAVSINVQPNDVKVTRFESGGYSSALVTIRGLPYGTANLAVTSWSTVDKLQALLSPALGGYAKVRAITSAADAEAEKNPDNGGDGSGSLKAWQATLIALGVTAALFIAGAVVWKRRKTDHRSTIADSLLDADAKVGRRINAHS